MRKLPVAAARHWKGNALAATARHCFFEASGGELARDGGQGGWVLQSVEGGRESMLKLQVSSQPIQ
jgi:hypothetical protein